MDNVILKTKRTEMKFPLPFITPQIIVEAIGNEETIALLERLGFVRKELLKNDTENKGKEVDRYWYKLLL